MAWKSLKDRVGAPNGLPHVLAGPVLRKVTPTTVTVWVVLRKGGKVTLTILDTDQMAGEGHTVAVGTSLHIVAVTATKASGATALVDGKIYRYDLSFDFDDGQSETLGSATNNANLAYAPFDKPSFCLPPKDIYKLRLIHGSCRIPHGNGEDTLPMLDKLIEKDAKNPNNRPHQLLLTGDQIYADDVGYAMSMMLMDASEALLGWTEEVVCNVPAAKTRRPVTDLYPGLRGHITQIDAHFTSVDFHGQLVGLGEYLAMYLFVWSDVLWPENFILPSFDEIKAFFSAREKDGDWEVLANQHVMDEVMGRKFRRVKFDEDDVDDETGRTAGFGRTTTNVRRALANIPTYMIFDDHEITDDWNMTRQFCANVYTSTLGMRIVQNGLTAYALCQHWGNAPEQFESATGGPGAKLLKLLDKMSSPTAYDGASEAARKLLGIAPLQGTLKGLLHGPDAFTYNYTIEADAYQVIVTDTRTWRNYPRGELESGDLLPLPQLQAQIAKAPPLHKDGIDRMQLVVLTTNAPPVQPIRTASSHPYLVMKLDSDPFPDLYESWEMSRDATDLLFRILSDRLPIKDHKRHGSVILLSGDVHTSFTSRLLFRGTKRFKDPQDQPQPVNVVFAQMVCSSLRKQNDKTEGMHLDGYSYAPTGTGWMVAEHEPEVYLGWNLAPNQTIVAGQELHTIGNVPIPIPIAIDRPRTYSIWDMPEGFKELEPHHWSYRLDYLTAIKDDTLPGAPPPLVPPGLVGSTPAERKLIAEVKKRTALVYARWVTANTAKRQMVGVNNIGEIAFNVAHAIHTLRWHDWATGTDRYTTYVCSLDPDDSAFHDLGLVT